MDRGAVHLLRPRCVFRSSSTVGLAACVALAFLGQSVASADRASGTWTGQLELRGNYYWEQSTRVVAPSAGFALEAPNGVRVNGEYLLDSITSASQAAGVLEDVRFTEIRHQGRLGTGYEFDLGDAQLDVSGFFQVSREPDYVSLSGGVGFALSLADRTTTLRARISVLHDEVRQRFVVGAGMRPDPEGGAVAFEESFNAVALVVGWEQILSPVVFFDLSYQYGWLDGFLSNAYRRVAVGDVLRPENHPGTRHRHTLTGRLATHIRATNTSIHLIYRTYYDTWRVAAITPEIRIYQRLARGLSARVRVRHYRQSSSFFYSENYQSDLAADAAVTADPKMSRFHNTMLGFQLLYRLSFLDGTRLDALRNAQLDFNFDYLWNTNRFGNGVISQVGIRVPF